MHEDQKVKRYYVQNGNDDKFEELTEEQYQRVLRGDFWDYVNNVIIVKEPEDDRSIPMYDILIENVPGCVVAEAFKMFKQLGLSLE